MVNKIKELIASDKKTIAFIVGILLVVTAAWYLFGSRSDVSDIGQSTDAIRTELSVIKGEIDETRGRADTISDGLKDIQTGIGSVSDRVESVTGKIDSVSSRIGGAQSELGSIREILDQNDSIYQSVRETGQIQN